MGQLVRRIFTQGEIIFNESDRQDVAFIIEEGEVEIWTNVDSEKRILNILGPGALFGELALVDRQPRSASASAIKQTILTVVTQQQVDERLADADPILRMVLFVVMRHFRSGVERARSQYGPYDRNRKAPQAVEHGGYLF
jgi:CRP-like cAMP-binding protein